MIHLTWDPVSWFVPVTAGLTVVALVLAVRGWQRGGSFSGVILPWLIGTAVLGMGVMQWHTSDQELLLAYSWYGERHPPVARFYLYVGGLGALPLLACFARPWMRRVAKRP